MQFPTIKMGGDPQVDGTVTRYVSNDAVGKPWYNPARSVIFVNGMMNVGEDHTKSALALSKMLGAQVYGVYNKKDGFFSDLWQCLTDKIKFTSQQKPDQRVLAHASPANAALATKIGAGALVLPPRSDFGQWSQIVDVLYEMEKAKAPALSKDDYVYDMLGGNAATKALYALLLGNPGGMLGTPIHAHSQGNLITSNALTGVALARGLGAIRGLEVHSYGSPAQGWPEGLNRRNNAFTFDPVGMLDGTVDWSSSKVGYKLSHGFPLTHAFEYYEKHDAEFVINSFRTGGWGMTVNMDEKGLAKYCASLGNHTDRLIRIFDRLESQHWTDSDDVTLEYLKLKSDTELAELQRIAPLLIEQFIRLLKAGYTANDESQAIKRLEGLRVDNGMGFRA